MLIPMSTDKVLKVSVTSKLSASVRKQSRAPGQRFPKKERLGSFSIILSGSLFIVFVSSKKGTPKTFNGESVNLSVFISYNR